MYLTRTLALAACLAVPVAGTAQHGAAAPVTAKPAVEAAQFDFLVGQWDLIVVPEVSFLVGRLHGAPKRKGTWKAWRAREGRGVEDELQIVDESGNPLSLTRAVRVYDGQTRVWKISATDASRATVSQSTAVWAAEVMTVTAASPVVGAGGKSAIARSRFTDITPTTFKYVQERSHDEGRTWEVVVRIEGRRTAASAPR